MKKRIFHKKDLLKLLEYISELKSLITEHLSFQCSLQNFFQCSLQNKNTLHFRQSLSELWVIGEDRRQNDELFDDAIFADILAQLMSYRLFVASWEKMKGQINSDVHYSNTKHDLVEIFSDLFPIQRELSRIFFIELIEENDSIRSLLERIFHFISSSFCFVDISTSVEDLSLGDELLEAFEPLLYFREELLSLRDGGLRKKRGIYYTPMVIASSVVQFVNDELRQEWKLPLGLASEMLNEDQQLCFFDVAMGSGVFLLHIVAQIRKNLWQYWSDLHLSKVEKLLAWKEYVFSSLLPRLRGVEINFISYVISHFLMRLFLEKLDCVITDHRLIRFLWTNTLALSPTSLFPCNVIIGNPPYSVVSSHLLSNDCLTRYKLGLEERNIQPLSDDYIRFFAFAHQSILNVGDGLIAYITNHTYLRGLLHRQMRKALLEDFSKLSFLDLHGNVLLVEKTPNGRRDTNLFNIRQGIALGFLVRHLSSPHYEKYLNKTNTSNKPIVCLSDLWGTKEEKYRFLRIGIKRLSWQQIEPIEPYYFFSSDILQNKRYENWISLSDIFSNRCTGFFTGCDASLISFSSDKIRQVVGDLSSSDISDIEIEKRWGLKESRSWNLSRRRKKMFNEGIIESAIQMIAYRPFDFRYTYYHDLLQRGRFNCLDSLDIQNIALISSRMIKGESPAHIFVAKTPVEKIFLSSKSSNNAYIFPLYSREKREGEYFYSSNISNKFMKAINEQFFTHATSDFPSSQEFFLEPKDIFYYIYGILHTPRYRRDYRDFLAIDFPRIPIVDTLESFKEFVRLGADLVGLHLFERKPHKMIGSFFDGGDRRVQQIASKGRKMSDILEGKGVIKINKVSSFVDIPQDVWFFSIGGYRVCYKWLSERKKHRYSLSDDDIKHFLRMVSVIQETLDLYEQLDDIYLNFS